MKISRYEDGSKSIEVRHDDNDDSIVEYNGDVTVRTKHRDSGEVSTVANISQHGEYDFIQRPRVDGEQVALISETGVDITSTHRTIVDNLTTTIALCPVQETVTVLYSVSNLGATEKGVITITEHFGNYITSVEQHSQEGYFADLEFTASESNGSLLLNVIGSGAGLITDFKYRVNTVNTLYI